MNAIRNGVILLTGVSLLTSCTNADLIAQLPDNRPNYKTSSTVNPLEIPPDLTQSSIDDALVVAELSGTENAHLSDYLRERTSRGEKTTVKQGRLERNLQNIHRSGDATWIEINSKPDAVFANAKNFWLSNGLTLSRVDASIGIMETRWLEPTGGGMPKSGIMALVSGVISGLTDEGVRDKFRTRIDYDGARSYVYVTHYGATEEEINRQGKVIKNGTNGDNSASYAWIASSRNPELEVEMLRRLNLYLEKGGKQSAQAKNSRASAPESAQASAGAGRIAFRKLPDGTPALLIEADFNRAWTLLGIAIDRAGYELSEQNRRGGTYTFAKVTEKKVGFIFTDVEREVDSYKVGLSDQGNYQIAVIISNNGKKAIVKQSQTVLQKIAEKINF